MNTLKILEEVTIDTEMPLTLGGRMHALAKEGYTVLSHSVSVINKDGVEHLLYSIIMGKEEVKK